MNKRVSGFLFGLGIVFFALFTGACKEEEINCASVESQLERIWIDLQVAALEGNCAEVSSLFTKSFSLLRKGKNCEYVVNLVADEGYTNVEDYIEYLEEERDRVLDALSC